MLNDFFFFLTIVNLLRKHSPPHFTVSYRILFCHATNFELFSHFDEINQVFIVYVHFSHVHEVQNRAQHLTFDAIDEEHGM